MTNQIRDNLEYRGELRSIRALPLTGCPARLPESRSLLTACRRGYIGSWQFRGDVLGVARLSDDWRQQAEGFLDALFPGHAGFVPAEWFSGWVPANDVSVSPAEPAGLWFGLLVRRGNVLLEETFDTATHALSTRLTPHVESLAPADEVAFLRAVHAAPADPAPQYGYADWLEERGDPRGPLLRREAGRIASGERQRRDPRLMFDVREPGPPTGFVDPADTLWFWTRLAGIPEPTPEDVRYLELVGRLRP